MKVTNAIRTLAFICLACFGSWSVNETYARDDHPSTEQTNDAALHRLLTARYESAIKALEYQRQKWQSGKATMESVTDASARMRDAMLELSAQHQEKLDVLTKHVALTRELEEAATKMVDKGILPEGEIAAARYWRLTAEIDLLRNQLLRQTEPDPKKLSERHEFQLRVLAAEIKKFLPGKSALFNLEQFAKDLRDVEMEMSTTQVQRIAALARYAAFLRAFERHATGQLERTEIDRLCKDAESELESAKAALDQR